MSPHRFQYPKVTPLEGIGPARRTPEFEAPDTSIGLGHADTAPETVVAMTDGGAESLSAEPAIEPTTISKPQKVGRQATRGGVVMA